VSEKLHGRFEIVLRMDAVCVLLDEIANKRRAHQKLDVDF